MVIRAVGRSSLEFISTVVGGSNENDSFTDRTPKLYGGPIPSYEADTGGLWGSLAKFVRCAHFAELKRVKMKGRATFG